MQLGIIGVVLAIVLAGGFLLFSGRADQSAEKETMEKEAMMQKEAEKEAMLQKEAMEKEAMMKDEAMKKDDEMKKDDAMEKKDGAMNEDGAMMDKSSDASMTDEKNAMVAGAATTQQGSYEAYSPEKVARAQRKVVMFFRASWCPTCRKVDADIRGHLSAIPRDVTILDVNYDTETALKKKYGVTYQHTFVQVDPAGNQLAKWSGSPTLAALTAEIQ